jgi:hypothetical protein
MGASRKPRRRERGVHAPSSLKRMGAFSEDTQSERTEAAVSSLTTGPKRRRAPLNRLRQGYGGPPKLHATAEGVPNARTPAADRGGNTMAIRGHTSVRTRT